MIKKLKIGIIGCSQIAENSIIPAIKKSKFAELEYIGSRSKHKGRKFAEKFHCNNFGSYEDVLENKHVDLVYISTPVGLHEKWTMKSTKNQKHVLCEKSSTSSYKSAKKMVKSALDNNVRLMEGLMFRFHPSHKKVIDFIKKNYLGKTFAFYGRYGFPPISKNNIRYNKKLGGGIINDAICYPVCASRFIFGNEPKKIYASVEIEPKSRIDEKISVTLDYDNNYYAQMISGYNLFYQNSYSIWGKNGTINLSRAYNISPNMNPKLSIKSKKLSKEFKIKSDNHFILMINSFCKNILKNQIDKNDLEIDLLKQAKVMEAIRLSVKQKKSIKLDTIK
jgi:dTDP-3,4-didehydro-2,6-dideoxy-alpha-D-glucose 3-reductase